MLAMICNDQPQGSKLERWQTHLVFTFSKDRRVDSNISFADKYPDKYNLIQEYSIPVPPAPTLAGTYVPQKVWLQEPRQYLHPLDMVTIPGPYTTGLLLLQLGGNDIG